MNKPFLVFTIAALAVLGVGSFYVKQHQTGTFTNPAVSESSPSAGLETASQNPLSIDALRARTYPGSDLQIESKLNPGANYNQYIASYISDGLKIYGLLTVPTDASPQDGWPAIIFNHGYLQPDTYTTTGRYVA